MAVGDCSVTERRRWRPPYQTGKTAHVHAKHYKHNEDGRTAPGVCGNGSVPLSHSGNVVTRIGTHTHTYIEFNLVNHIAPRVLALLSAIGFKCILTGEILIQINYTGFDSVKFSDGSAV